MFSIYKLSFFLLQTLTTTTLMNRTRTRSMHTYTKHHTCMCGCRRRRCIVATFHFAHIFGCDSIGIEWTHTLTPDHLVYIGIFCRWLYCVDNRKFAYTIGYGKPKPATTTACTTTTNTSSWVQWAISVQTRSVYYTHMHAYTFTALICKVLGVSVLLLDSQRCWCRRCLCKIRAHTSIASIFGFLVCYFIRVAIEFIHTRTHAKCSIVKLSIFLVLLLLRCLFLLAANVYVVFVACNYCFYVGNSKRIHTPPHRIRCSAFPIFTSQLNTRCSICTKCKIWKWLECSIAWLCVSECALARIFSRPPKNELVYSVSKMIVFITWKCKRKLIENEMHEIWMERVLYLSCKRLSLTAC